MFRSLPLPLGPFGVPSKIDMKNEFSALTNPPKDEFQNFGILQFFRDHCAMMSFEVEPTLTATWRNRTKKILNIKWAASYSCFPKFTNGVSRCARLKNRWEFRKYNTNKQSVKAACSMSETHWSFSIGYCIVYTYTCVKKKHTQCRVVKPKDNPVCSKRERKNTVKFSDVKQT